MTDDCSTCDGRGKHAVVNSNGDTIERWDDCPTCLGSGKHVDWKYAMHMLRLGFQGVEFLTTGKLTLPVPAETGDWLREVRQGNVEFADVIAVAESLEQQVKNCLDDTTRTLCRLPDEPRALKIEQWVISTHLAAWKTQGFI